jgi:hypothetical protein
MHPSGDEVGLCRLSDRRPGNRCVGVFAALHREAHLPIVLQPDQTLRHRSSRARDALDDAEIAVAVEIHRLRARRPEKSAMRCITNFSRPVFSSHWTPCHGRPLGGA